MNVRALFLFLFLLLLLPAAARAEDGFWRVEGDEAFVTSVLAAGDAGERRFATLVVAFDPGARCERAEIGAVVAAAPELGAPQKRGASAAQLAVAVDEEAVFSEKTVMTTYAHGFEMAFFAPAGMVEKLESGHVAHAAMDEAMPLFEFSLEGAGAAIGAARQNCAAALPQRGPA